MNHNQKRCPDCIALIPARWTCCDACAGKRRERAVASSAPKDQLRALERQIRRSATTWIRAEDRGLVDMHTGRPLATQGTRTVVAAGKIAVTHGDTTHVLQPGETLTIDEGGCRIEREPPPPPSSEICCECLLVKPPQGAMRATGNTYLCCFDCCRAGRWETTLVRQVDKAAGAALVSRERAKSKEYQARQAQLRRDHDTRRSAKISEDPDPADIQQAREDLAVWYERQADEYYMQMRMDFAHAAREQAYLVRSGQSAWDKPPRRA